MNRFLTEARNLWRRGLAHPRCRRLISQASALAARVSSWARAALEQMAKDMDQVARVTLEMLYARRMAVREFFLVNPRDPSSPLSAKGRMVLAHWFKQAHTFNHSYAPELNAEMKGMQKMLDIIITDIFADLPSIAQQMAEEERRQAEEIVHAA